MRVVVTGGAGFIGSTLVDRLVHDNHEVVVVDDLSSGRDTNLDAARAHGVAVHRIDIRDPELADVMSEARPEVCFHLAAQVDVRCSVADPANDASINVVGTIAVALAAHRAGCRRIVFASSGGTVYGEPAAASLPVSEEHPLLATNPYGVAKRSAEDYLHSFHGLLGLEFVALRLANVYGPRQDPHGEAGVVSIFCQRLKAGQTLTIYGDGRQTRDYIYVDDVVDAFVRAGLRNAAAGQRLNVGTGEETSVLDLVAALTPISGVSPRTRPEPARTGELERIALNAARAREILDWEPTVALPDGLSRTWAAITSTSR